MRRFVLPGSARSFDHCTLVSALWKRFVELQVAVWVERVPTNDNIADNPSRYDCPTWLCNRVSTSLFACLFREDYGIMQRIKAKWAVPVLDDLFRQPSTWSGLSLRGVRTLKRKRASEESCPSAAGALSGDVVSA